MTQSRRQVKSRMLTMFAFATLVPMVAFGYLAHNYAVSQTLDQASIRLRAESKTYALILLERLQTYAGIDAYDTEPAERPQLSLDRDNDRIIIGRSRHVPVDIWLRDLNTSIFQRCLIIDGVTYRCSDNLPANTETLGQTWQLFLEGNFTTTFDISVRTTTTKKQVLQTLSPLEQLYPLLTLLISVCLCWVAYRFLHRRLKPLTTLEAATTAIASGNYDTLVEFDSGDEFESLGVSFNEMSRTLQNSAVRLKQLADIDRMILSSADPDEIIGPDRLSILSDGAGNGGRGAESARAQGFASSVNFRDAFHDAKQRLVDRFEREYLAQVVARTGGNMSEAARQAGIDRTTLYRLMEKHRLSKDAFSS